MSQMSRKNIEDENIKRPMLILDPERISVLQIPFDLHATMSLSKLFSSHLKIYPHAAAAPMHYIPKKLQTPHSPLFALAIKSIFSTCQISLDMCAYSRS